MIYDSRLHKSDLWIDIIQVVTPISESTPFKHKEQLKMVFVPLRYISIFSANLQSEVFMVIISTGEVVKSLSKRIWKKKKNAMQIYCAAV